MNSCIINYSVFNHLIIVYNVRQLLTKVITKVNKIDHCTISDNSEHILTINVLKT